MSIDIEEISTTPVPNGRVSSEPTMKDLLNASQRQLLLNLNCHALATIQSFSPVLQTVTATVNYKKTFKELDQLTGVYVSKLVEYPLLIDMPIVILQGGGAALTMPISEGDTCVVLFNDRDIDNWLFSGQIAAPNTGRLHSFADGIALIGVNSSLDPILDYDPDNAVLRNGLFSKVSVGESEIEITNGVSSVTMDTAIEATNMVSTIKIAELIKIGNLTGTLGGILQDLITTLSALMTIPAVPGSPLTLSPTVIAQLAVISARLALLLE